MPDEIKRLQNELVCTYQRLMGKECGSVFEDVEIMAAYEAAIEAMEKQVPKKPKRTAYNSTPNYIYCSCPVCNMVVARIKKDKYGEFWEKHLPNYCDYCGQAIDWPEVEE